MQNRSSLIELSQSDEFWLNALIEAYFKNEKVDLISLSIRLNKKLDKDFDYKKIDYYSLTINETKPTLFTIRIIDPKAATALAAFFITET